MGFWCKKIVPNKTVAYVPSVDQEPRVHISQASLTPNYQDDGGTVFLMIKSDEQEFSGQEKQDDFVVFAVLSDANKSVGLDLLIDRYTEFKIEGNSEVHLTGYHMPDIVEAEDDDYDDYEDEEDELRPDMELFGDDDDDDIHEDLQNLQANNISANKQSCIIEELDDEDEDQQIPDKQKVLENKQLNMKGESSKKQKKNKKRKVEPEEVQQDQEAPGPSNKKSKTDEPKIGDVLKKGEIRTLPNGLQIIQKQVGFDDAKQAKNGKQIRISYVVRLAQNQKIIDSSKNFKFRLGLGKVVPGMDEGCVGMRVGDERTIICPPNLGYGQKGIKGEIPPNSTLQFEVTLLHVK